MPADQTDHDGGPVAPRRPHGRSGAAIEEAATRPGEGLDPRVLAALTDRSWRTWIDDLTGGTVGSPAAAVAVVALIVVLGAWAVGWLPGGGGGGGAADVPMVVAPAPGTQDVRPPPRDGQPLPSSHADGSVEPGGAVVVHVAGAVGAPGVVEVAGGSRVADALVAAGSALPDADLDRLNLAAPLVDGARIYVPRIGEEQLPSEVPGLAPGGVPGAGAAPSEEPVSINRATALELEALSGVGPATAAAIVEHREANGPFTSVDALLDVRGIGEAKLEALRAHVVL